MKRTLARDALSLLAVALCAGCGREPAPTPPAHPVIALSGADADTVPIWITVQDSVTHGFAFTPEDSANARLGVLAFSFRVPTVDNAGTCDAPIPDSSQTASPIYARVFYERRDYSSGVGVDETVAETLWVERGQTVYYARRVPADTFTTNIRLCDAGGCGCRTYFTQIATRTIPGAVEVLNNGGQR
jgi:hypothetical protein